MGNTAEGQVVERYLECSGRSRLGRTGRDHRRGRPDPRGPVLRSCRGQGALPGLPSQGSDESLGPPVDRAAGLARAHPTVLRRVDRGIRDRRGARRMARMHPVRARRRRPDRSRQRVFQAARGPTVMNSVYAMTLSRVSALDRSHHAGPCERLPKFGHTALSKRRGRDRIRCRVCQATQSLSS